MSLKHFFKMNSLKQQFIFLYSFVVVICVIILSLTIFLTSKHTMEQIGYDNTKQNTLSSLSHLNTFIDDIEYTALLIQNNEELLNLLDAANDLPIQERIDKITKILNSHDIFQRKIEKIELYSLVSSEFPAIHEGSSAIYRSDEQKNDVRFNQTLNSNYKSVFFINNNAIEPYITFSKLIADPITKEPIAILNIDINVSTLYSQLGNVKLYDNDMMFLATDTTILPYNTKEPYQFLNNNTLFNNMIKDGIESAETNIDEHTYLLHCLPIQDTTLYLVNAVNTANFNVINKSMLLSISVTAIPFVIFMFLTLYFISYTVINPITVMSKHMREYKEEKSAFLPSQDVYNQEMDTLYSSFNNMIRIINELMEDTKKQGEILRETEFKVLQAQIKPHFLYNTLNSISAMASDIKADKIQNMITNLALFFRYSLNSGMEFISIEDELKQVLAYASIQKSRKNDKFSINVDVEPSIMQYKICKLILQPLVENSIEHGFKFLTQGGIIKIKGYEHGDNIILSISDNGAGLNFASIEDLNTIANSEPNEASSSFGIYNTNKRIKLYYGEHCGLIYSENEMNGITAVIKLTKSQNHDKTE